MRAFTFGLLLCAACGADTFVSGSDAGGGNDAAPSTDGGTMDASPPPYCSTVSVPMGKGWCEDFEDASTYKASWNAMGNPVLDPGRGVGGSTALLINGNPPMRIDAARAMPFISQAQVDLQLRPEIAAGGYDTFGVLLTPHYGFIVRVVSGNVYLVEFRTGVTMTNPITLDVVPPSPTGFSLAQMKITIQQRVPVIVGNVTVTLGGKTGSAQLGQSAVTNSSGEMMTPALLLGFQPTNPMGVVRYDNVVFRDQSM